MEKLTGVSGMASVTFSAEAGRIGLLLPFDGCTAECAAISVLWYAESMSRVRCRRLLGSSSRLSFAASRWGSTGFVGASTVEGFFSLIARVWLFRGTVSPRLGLPRQSLGICVPPWAFTFSAALCPDGSALPFSCMSFCRPCSAGASALSGSLLARELSRSSSRFLLFRNASTLRLARAAPRWAPPSIFSLP